MRILTRLALTVTPVLVASGLLLSGPAYADGSCQWGSTSIATNGTVVVNGFQFQCLNNNAGTTPQWNLNGHTSAPDTPGIQSSFDPGLDPGSFSSGAGLLGDDGFMYQQDGGGWVQAGTYDDWYGSSGDLGGGSGGDPGELLG